MALISRKNTWILALAGVILSTSLWAARPVAAAAPQTGQGPAPAARPTPDWLPVTGPLTLTISTVSTETMAWTVPLPGGPARTGTPIAAAAAPIAAGNVSRLANVAQWGQGTLLAVAFSPDGRHFVAGSAFRLAVYDLAAPENPPVWLNLEPPVSYVSLAFSADGQYLRFDNPTGSQVRRLANGQILADSSGLAWQPASSSVEIDGAVTSPDGRLRLDSQLYSPEDDYNHQISSREIINQATGKRLYALSDPTMYVRYEDRSTPEGCDLYSFSYCGNAYDPAAMTPYRAAFAPDSDSLAVLYRAPDIWNTSSFSILKVYATRDGALRQVWGTFAQPVQSFAFAPSGQQLLVGYVDGSVTLWDLTTQAMTFGARHFSGPVYDLAFSADSRLLLLKTPGELEIRTANDGGLWQRLAAETFAASSVENLVALGQANGWLQLLDLATGHLQYSQPTHAGGIRALAFSADGQLLASSGQDCRVVLSNAHSGEFKHLFQANSTKAYGEDFTQSRIFIDSMTFVPGTHQLIGYGSWSRVVSWNVNSGATQYFIEPDPLAYYNGMVTLNPHFPEFFDVNSTQHTFMVDSARYDLASGQKLGEYHPPATLAAGCEPFGPVSQDGTLQFTRGYEEHTGQVCILAARDQHLLGAITVVPPAESAPALGWPYLSPDGRQLAVTVSSGPVFVYQVGSAPVTLQ